jgi:succinate dehydrogenase / fumarate reductase iron-sulfur subunit
MNLTLKIWRQANKNAKGEMKEYQISGIEPDMSFLEMMDILNEDLIKKDIEPIAFDHDCREGICGMCSLFINGRPHGPDDRITTCQLHMRKFKDGDTIYIEPWRAKAFPVIKDLVVDRTAFDRIIQSGGYVNVNTSGNTIDANAIPIPKLEEQLQIVEHLDSKTKEIDDLVSLEQKKIDLLKEYRQSLISEVVTGKIDITL